MSLENPTMAEKAIDYVKQNANARIVIYAVCALVIFGAVLFTFDKCSDWRFESRQNKLKANVNKALSEAGTIANNIANLKEQQAAQAEAVNKATREYVDAQNYTDATREEVNKAIGNMVNAAKANGNISVKELEEKLKGL